MNDAQCKDMKIGELLHAYELGLLDDDEKRQFEIHLLECEHCLGQIQEFHGHAAALRHDDEIKEAVADLSGERSAHPWTVLWTSAILNLRPIYAVAAALLLLVIGYSVSRLFTDRQVASVQVVTLLPSRSSSHELFDRSVEQDGLLSVVIEEAVPGQVFDLILSNDEGRAIGPATSFVAVDSFVVCHVLFPAELMKPGAYSVLAVPRSEGNAADTIRYVFRVVDRK